MLISREIAIVTQNILPLPKRHILRSLPHRLLCELSSLVRRSVVLELHVRHPGPFLFFFGARFEKSERCFASLLVCHVLHLFTHSFSLFYSRTLR